MLLSRLLVGFWQPLVFLSCLGSEPHPRLPSSPCRCRLPHVGSDTHGIYLSVGTLSCLAGALTSYTMLPPSLAAPDSPFAKSLTPCMDVFFSQFLVLPTHARLSLWGGILLTCLGADISCFLPPQPIREGPGALCGAATLGHHPPPPAPPAHHFLHVPALLCCSEGFRTEPQERRADEEGHRRKRTRNLFQQALW